MSSKPFEAESKAGATASPPRSPRRGTRLQLSEFAFVLPQLLLYVGLLVVPFLIALPIVATDQVSFLDADPGFVGWDNFSALLREPLYGALMPALRRTIVFTLVYYVLAIVFGLSLALALYEMSSRLRASFFTIIYMPWMISGVGLGMMIVMLFSPDTGTFNLLIEWLGGPRSFFDAKSDMATAIGLPLFFAWKTAGLNMALFLGGLLAIPVETVESARIDGANFAQRVVHIYVPQIVPSFVMVSIFALINGFGIFDELVGLGGLAGNSAARFLSVLVYELGFAASENYGARTGTLAQAITVSLVVFAPLMLLAFTLNVVQRRLQYS